MNVKTSIPMNRMVKRRGFILLLFMLSFFSVQVSASDITVNGDTALVTFPIPTRHTDEISDFKNLEGFGLYSTFNGINNDSYFFPDDLALNLSCTLSVELKSEDSPRTVVISGQGREPIITGFNSNDVPMTISGMCNAVIKNMSSREVSFGKIVPLLFVLIHDGGHQNVKYAKVLSTGATLSPKTHCFVDATPSVVTFHGLPEDYVGGKSENIRIRSSCSSSNDSPVLRFGSSGSSTGNGCVIIQNESGKGELNFCVTHDGYPVALDNSTGISSGPNTAGEALTNISVTMKADRAGAVGLGTYPAVLFIVVSPW